ncbi:MAG: hypothetical protein LC650_01200 [Actinobacteria bacterium]|nr:hypothetical protein [Actinomycetota bacterium]
MVRISFKYLAGLALVVVALTLNPVAADHGSDDSMLKSKAKLTTLDAYSAIPIDDFITIPDLQRRVGTAAQGGWVAEFVTDNVVATGFENLYNIDNVFPGVILYNTFGDELAETDRIQVPPFVGLASSAVSANEARPLTAMSFYESVGLPGVAFLPHKYTVRIDRFDVQTGQFDATPALEYDLSQVDPDFYNATIAYNGVAGMSKDGRYLVLTYGTGTPAPPGFPFSQFLTGNRYAIAELAADGSSLTILAILDSPPTGKPGIFSFAQKAIMTPMKRDGSVYNVLIATDSWNLQAPFGTTAQMCYYTFDTATNAFDEHGCVWAPEYIQGVGYDTENQLLYGIGNRIADGDITASQIPRTPYDNPAEDKTYNLRIHEIDEKKREISYKGGLDTQSDGIQVQPSRDGKTLMTVTAPAITTSVFSTMNNPLSTIGRLFSPNMATTYTVRGKGKLEMQDSAVVAPLTFGIGFDSSGDRAFMSGQDTYVDVDGNVAGLKGNQLFGISKSNGN